MSSTPYRQRIFAILRRLLVVFARAIGMAIVFWSIYWFEIGEPPVFFNIPWMDALLFGATCSLIIEAADLWLPRYLNPETVKKTWRSVSDALTEEFHYWRDLFSQPSRNPSNMNWKTTALIAAVVIGVAVIIGSLSIAGAVREASAVSARALRENTEAVQLNRPKRPKLDAQGNQMVDLMGRPVYEYY